MVQGGESSPRNGRRANAVFGSPFNARGASPPSRPIVQQLWGALNVVALSAFLAYVGAGLNGRAGFGNFNLQMNNNYQGRVVKGCPAYNGVRQTSIDGFDLKKYQGKWYEQKFHDWTQFKEVYDTTLDIKLTPDRTASERPKLESSSLSNLLCCLHWLFTCAALLVLPF